MSKYRTGSHTKTRLTVHLVWVTKYGYKILVGEVQSRCRDLIIQDCKSLDIEILKGFVSKDHLHIHIEYPPKLSISIIMKQLKGRSSRLLQRAPTREWKGERQTCIELGPNTEPLKTSVGGRIGLNVLFMGTQFTSRRPPWLELQSQFGNES